MLIKTRYFGEINLGEEKIITFDQGLIGFEEYKRYTLLYDVEGDRDTTISWLQSVEEQSLALPVINPLIAKSDYNPTVDDEMLSPLGDLNQENMVVLLTLTVPSDITKTTANLKAPIVINSDIRKGCQVIVENQDYGVKHNIYEVISRIKAEKGEA